MAEAEFGIIDSIRQDSLMKMRNASVMRNCFRGIWRMHLRLADGWQAIVEPNDKETDMDLNSTSKFISLILRHKPETIGITLDEHGWANVEELIEGIRKTRPFDREMLEEIVRTDKKQRYSFSEDKTLIRANQGHSIPVDMELPVTVST